MIVRLHICFESYLDEDDTKNNKNTKEIKEEDLEDDDNLEDLDDDDLEDDDDE